MTINLISELLWRTSDKHILKSQAVNDVFASNAYEHELSASEKSSARSRTVLGFFPSALIASLLLQVQSLKPEFSKQNVHLESLPINPPVLQQARPAIVSYHLMRKTGNRIWSFDPVSMRERRVTMTTLLQLSCGLQQSH